jgi:hypothetical protein
MDVQTAHCLPRFRAVRALAIRITGENIIWNELVRNMTMDESTREQIEAAVFRQLLSHLRERSDVQNIDMMITAGFCRNCLGDWFGQAAAARGVELSKEDARALIYGMPQEEWKRRYQKETTPEQRAAFAGAQNAQKTHS